MFNESDYRVKEGDKVRFTRKYNGEVMEFEGVFDRVDYLSYQMSEDRHEYARGGDFRVTYTTPDGKEAHVWMREKHVMYNEHGTGFYGRWIKPYPELNEF